MSPIIRDRNDRHNCWSTLAAAMRPQKQLLQAMVLWCLVSSLLADLQLEPLTACQHLRQAETRRSRALSLEPANGRRAPVRIPKCSRSGNFEPVQCSNEISATECWCVDAYGLELAGTRRDTDASTLQCPSTASDGEQAPDVLAAANATAADCPASSCRMYCPAGFARDPRSGCPKCQCRDPCDGIDCPGGQSCQLQEVRCASEPCPPVPTCKKARSLSDLCPAGQPLTIAETPRPFLCGHEPGKPQCPPLYRCLVQSGNDYGVCCPASVLFQKPGQCPPRESQQRTAAAGQLCGSPCAVDLECGAAEKCCETEGCARNCRQPFNVSACQQARLVSELMSIGEREGRGYVPECDNAIGGYARRQCSRNGLVCWCVDQRTGHKMRDTMGAAMTVDCERLQRKAVVTTAAAATAAAGRSHSRSIDTAQQQLCDQNICAAVCEYGFKIDHNGCPTCECAEPCDGFRCAAGSHCEVARDERCASASALCASEPVCKPDLVYTNPCEEGVPLASNQTGEVQYCRQEEQQSREFQSQSFWDAQPSESRSLTNLIECPDDYQCTKLYRESESVCCPRPMPSPEPAVDEGRPQSMCEYLRDFSDRMEGTEAGMVLALPTPTCDADGHFEPRLCTRKTVRVTRAQRTRMLEEQNVREMRKLFGGAPAASAIAGAARSPRSVDGVENLKLYKVSADDDGQSEPQLDIKALIRYLHQNGNTAGHAEANYMAEILSRKLLSEAHTAQALKERSAKVIDVRADGPPLAQQLDRGAGKVSGSERTRAKPIGTTHRGAPQQQQQQHDENALVDVELNDCFCVDGFGTEIPQSRGTNITVESCAELRDTLDCLDITCRMGCDYGFILDPDTRCPTCECRDPCDSVACPDGQECRSVEVSCEGEYCPPVPACLPRKPGQCPFLVPPGTEGSTIDTCEYECRSDQHCPGARRCCSNGCGTQCVEPQLKTACQHLQTIQLHQATELGIPAKQKYIAQCNATTGAWLRVQCGPGDVCWCSDTNGNELSGTRRAEAVAAAMECEEMAVQSRRNDACGAERCAERCEFGYMLDEAGCRTCRCRSPCDEISCPGGEQCQLMRVECIDEPCPKMPVCVPQRESVCLEGRPFRRNGLDLVCGPQGDADACPSTHTCQLDVESKRGVCCAKTRDVCFESVDNGCVSTNGSASVDSLLTWRFSPKQNKCVQMLAERTCQSKNLFHSEAACASVCPVLSACERLRLRNSLAGKRLQQSTAWFQPRCDPETGSWSPVQCLGKSAADIPTIAPVDRQSNGVSRAFAVHEPPATGVNSPTAVGVCWCADKKGAPLQGSLTRGIEPTCNHRQARRRLLDRNSGGGGDAAILHDPMIEQLIGQITLIAEEDNLIDTAFEDEALVYHSSSRVAASVASATERIMAIANAAGDRPRATATGHRARHSTVRLQSAGTRCQALSQTASFPVACSASGSFEPQQCNDESVCWCVDAAGNQLPQSSTFSVGATLCPYTPIDTVAVELHLPNPQQIAFENLYDTLRAELRQLFGGQIPDNLRVHEQPDGNSIYVQFDLTGSEWAVDTAFALEEMVRQGAVVLAHGELVPDITLSRFTHRTAAGPLPGPQSAALRPESTFQMIVFVLASSSAFLVSVFVVFVMLKRGRGGKKLMMGPGGSESISAYETGGQSKVLMGMGDKFLDYSSPIFVLSASEMKVSNSNEEQLPKA